MSEEPTPEFSLEMTFALLDGVEKVFGAMDIKLFLCFGGLIGALREGKMIPWDGDLDLVFNATNLGGAPGIDKIVEALKPEIHGQVLPRVISGSQHGYIWDVQVFHSVPRPHKGPWHHNYVTYGQICLFPLYRDKRGWWHIKEGKHGDYRGWLFPHYMFDPPTERTITLNGRIFNIPNGAEELLAEIYGDWKTPSKKKSTHPKEIYGKLPPTLVI